MVILCSIGYSYYVWDSYKIPLHTDTIVYRVIKLCDRHNNHEYINYQLIK